MTLPHGQLSFSNINTELQKNPTDQISLGDSNLRVVFEKPTLSNIDFQSGWDRGLLKWGSTGLGTRTAISNGFSSFNNGDSSSITTSPSGDISFNRPDGNDSDTFISSGNAYLYRIRVYCGAGSTCGISDQDGNTYAFPGNWSNYLGLGSVRTFIIGYTDASYQGTVEISNFSNSQVITVDYSGSSTLAI